MRKALGWEGDVTVTHLLKGETKIKGKGGLQGVYKVRDSTLITVSPSDLYIICMSNSGVCA